MVYMVIMLKILQLNGFNNAIINDCDIGPSSINIPVTGRYLHARVLLRRYKHLVDLYCDETLTFINREYVDELILQMDMIHNYYIDGIE